MTRWWVDCCSRLYHGDRRIFVDRDVVHRVLRKYEIDVAVSAWIPDRIAREILERAGVRRSAHAA